MTSLMQKIFLCVTLLCMFISLILYLNEGTTKLLDSIYYPSNLISSLSADRGKNGVTKIEGQDQEWSGLSEKNVSVRPLRPLLNYTINPYLEDSSVPEPFEASPSANESVLHFPKPLFYSHGFEDVNLNASIFLKGSSEEKLVLFYTKTYSLESWLSEYFLENGFYYLKSKKTNQTCPYKCAFTYDKSLSEKASAVIFSILDFMYHPETPKYPKKRYKHQYWIAQTAEAPWYHDTTNVRISFNWTATYRLDSDIYFPYGYFYKRDKFLSLDSIYIPNSTVLRKKKLVAALISNCNAYQRNLVIRELKQHLEIDIYGKCGTLKCPEPDVGSEKCRDYIGSKYKFFLAFENSLCQDYITEKFFSTFKYNVIPVTFGLGNYSEVAPPHSYINVLDFATIKNLTDYILFLNNNDDEYVKYFHWKQDYILGDNSNFEQFCSLCSKLWKGDRHISNYSYYKNFQSWWVHKRPIDQNFVGDRSLKSFQLLNSSDSGCFSFPFTPI